ncbi:N-acyl-L-amino-acid amidohydrolase [Planoprotostelium fungivorum]|uniref:N-acyl-L-amino-acid amidohydrolase n=1 Tax=Planoprotostelium fungivorum TaxID=1890364 RepID=A0A2P6NGS2_9EUKA|nr:N-acyl-L-amino-acid amidohydrolase [Planoprotostelium fungivorum]
MEDHPQPQNEEAVNFLIALGKEAGLESEVIEVHPGRPVAILSWKGSDPSLPSVLLSNHYDVVPVQKDKWKCDPWAAEKDGEGNIFGRGTQDMKSVGIQYIYALKRLKTEGYQPLRTIYIVCVPDEEIGGKLGMSLFVQSPTFKKMNVGVSLDEGLASPDDSFKVYYGERIEATAEGAAGHGSRFIEGTATQKLMGLVDQMMKFREEQFEKYQRDQHSCGTQLGDVISVTLTSLNAGVTRTPEGKDMEKGSISVNVIPTVAKAGFDLRIPPTENLERFMNMIRGWAQERGCTIDLLSGDFKNGRTDIGEDAKWWKVLKNSMQSINLKVDPQIFPAGTDSRFFRNMNIPAFGFSPINHTPVLLHDHNEYLNEKVFLKGIDVYTRLIRDLSSEQC